MRCSACQSRVEDGAELWLLQIKVCLVRHQGAPSGKGAGYEKDSTESLLSRRSISGDSKRGVSFGCLSPIHGWGCEGLAGRQGRPLISPHPHPSRHLEPRSIAPTGITCTQVQGRLGRGHEEQPGHDLPPGLREQRGRGLLYALC